MSTLKNILRKKFKLVLPEGKRGFTIIETLVAVLIVAVAVIGTTIAVQSALSSYNLSKDQVIAFYLGQEGIEQVRNVRDENILNGRYWLSGISQLSTDACYFGHGCTPDPTQPVVLIGCSSPTTCPLVRRSSDGSYGYSISWVATTFTRTIILTPLTSNEIAMTVTVTWPKGSFKAKVNLYNW